MQSVIKKITVKEDKRILSIEFVNGITHRFIYREEGEFDTNKVK
ncbi:hypothetical protein [Tissierella simiarum]|nr:hypothetical protein [Tissierella simiarum]